MSERLLARATPADVHTEPFPYLQLPQAVSSRLFASLSRDFPAPATDRTEYGYLRSPPANIGPPLAQDWCRFWQHHLSEDFLEDVWRVWGPTLQKVYPRLASRPRTLTITPPNRKPNFQLDALYTWRHIRGEDEVIAPHVDNVRTLFFILWYFRHPEDQSTGGGLWLYRRTPATTFTERFATAVEPAVLLPYAANQLVMVLNTADAIHGGERRGPSQYPRRHVGLNVETPGAPLFERK